MIAINLESEYHRTYESGFIALLNVHDVYLHCQNLVILVASVLKQITLFSSFGCLLIDSVVAPHGKIDVSRQVIKYTVHFCLRDVYGTVINLHSAAVSFSLVFATTG